MLMGIYRNLAESVKFTDKNKVCNQDASLELIGTGRSAVVFKIRSTNKALKVFYPDKSKIAKEEAVIYRKLADTPYFPTLYEDGENYLVIDYIDGKTIFECLVNGVRVTRDIIAEVDAALSLAREKGLNPSDVHLRNLIVTSEGQMKIIDVARFRQTKNCTQWRDLKRAFYSLYEKRFFPKRIPSFLLNMIALLYKKSAFFSLSKGQ